MTKNALDFKKEYPDLYAPGPDPVLLEPPAMPFIMVDGEGAPEGPAYQQALQMLYALAFTIKMSKMSGQQPQGYFEYVMPPLEGLWWNREDSTFDFALPREQWRWTSMIRQPDFVTPQVFAWALEACHKKKPALDVSRARLEIFAEGLCVQMLHVGAYDQEAVSLRRMLAFMTRNCLTGQTGSSRKHHEIYLSDPRKTAKERLKTILRLPVSREPC